MVPRAPAKGQTAVGPAPIFRKVAAKSARPARRSRSGPRAGRQHQSRGAPRPRHGGYQPCSRPPLLPSRTVPMRWLMLAPYAGQPARTVLRGWVGRKAYPATRHMVEPSLYEISKIYNNTSSYGLVEAGRMRGRQSVRLDYQARRSPSRPSQARYSNMKSVAANDPRWFDRRIDLAHQVRISSAKKCSEHLCVGMGMRSSFGVTTSGWASTQSTPRSPPIACSGRPLRPDR